ncbi:hypothetical protein EJ04DRAFT_507988 [Polyplosphaeria fusca]|uniref:Uncharacterized protein n=1 Tax=Polyplosphaeria fusca TaxID=682080 RepID=A0A9P4V8L4_9PLEO|nr:hypothetical protein EJ04DRAFT_507988 [Polyplosphaeria fusca]
MAPMTGFSKLSRLSLICAFSSILSPTHALEIFSRQAQTCGGNTNLFQCGGSLPSDFCCPNGSACVPINGTGMAATICCPKGADCSFVQTITCDVSQLNATKHPDNQVHLADTQNVELPKCGDACCPLGYSCNGGACSADNNASPSPSGTPTSAASPTSSATDPASASQTTAAVPAPVAKSEQGFDGKSFAAGFFPGIVLGGLLVVGLIWAVKKRREHQEKNRYSGDFGHVSRQISDPIYDPAYANRVDFIRRGSQSAQASPNSTIEMVKPPNNPQGGMTPRIKSLWARSPKLGFGSFSVNSTPRQGNTPMPPPPAVRAGNGDPYITPNRTPHRMSSRASQQRVSRRTHSSETIDVLMPAPSFLEPPRAPGMRENRMTADSGHTTFTKLMERAGYEENDRNEVRGKVKGSPARAR